jgi:nucleotide-binding universal stress UspA family protein
VERVAQSPIWPFDQADPAATHEEAGMVELLDNLLEALAGLPLWAVAAAVAVVMALEASLLTGQTFMPALVMRSGQPAAVLDRMAVEDGYGLVVVGTRGVGLPTVLLGSVVTRLAAHASVPVLVVGDRAGQEGGKRQADLVDQAEP